ncbi:hypothetical protein [Tropicimonas sediminicola]|uniref:Sulfotransferase family protein n=1 Tax=Tropicimonas sediminicola TaxID=1031541 RepID=A0A239KGN4_9RHOB|nr:hypothetical protein [Tropicimonas sediminicola]SNT17331.1 hypothetical protein SAMN05421757_107105 [Tropicimonas sediminicola]
MRAKVHIGTQKTGTTTLQDFLHVNRAALLGQGFLFRRYGRQGNQPELTVATFDRLGDLLGDEVLKVALGIRDLESQAAFARRFDAEIRRDTARHPDATVLFSCELLGAPRRNAKFVEAFHDWARGHFDDVEIIVYIRRQDRYAESCYSQYLRGGGSKPFDRYLEDFQPPNYNRLVRLWEAQFGADRVTVRRLQRKDLVGGDLIEDYCSVVGIDTAGLERPKSLNQSFTLAQADWLRKANARVPAALQRGQTDRAVRWAIRSLAGVVPPSGGAALRMSDAARNDLLGRVAASNEQLRKRRFPEDESLFEE